MEEQHKPKSIEESLEQITELIKTFELKQFRRDFLEKLALILIAALGFLTALAWEEALKITFQQIFGENVGVLTRFAYPVTITILTVIVSLLLSKLLSKKE